MSTPTLRRLDDRERYWGLTWPGWVAAVAGAGGLYLAVRFSPFGVKPTITITVFILAFVGMLVYGISGQALSPGRQLLAILSYHRSRKLLELSTHADRRGLVLDGLPNTAPPDPGSTDGAHGRLEDLLDPDDDLLRSHSEGGFAFAEGDGWLTDDDGWRDDEPGDQDDIEAAEDVPLDVQDDQ